VLLIESDVNTIADLLMTHWSCMSLRMDNPAAKISNFALFHVVLRLISSCTELVAREIHYAQQGSGGLSRVDQDKLKRISQGLAVLGLLTQTIDQSSRLQEQRPVRGERSMNIGAGTEKELSIVQDEEHAITPKPDGGALA